MSSEIDNNSTLPDPIPGEIICWIDDAPIYAVADAGEVEAPEELPEELELPDEELTLVDDTIDFYVCKCSPEELAAIRKCFDPPQNYQI